MMAARGGKKGKRKRERERERTTTVFTASRAYSYAYPLRERQRFASATLISNILSHSAPRDITRYIRVPQKYSHSNGNG